MIDTAFWKEVRDVWIVKATPQIEDVKVTSGGAIDPGLLKDPCDMDEIPFDMVDFDHVTKDILNGGDIPLKNNISNEAVPSDTQESEPEVPKLDADKFESLLENQTIPDYIEACRLLRVCALPDDMDDLYEKIVDRMQVLSDAIKRFKEVYQADLTQFYEYYIPETLQLTASYLEYRNIGISEEIMRQTAQEVMNSAEQLLIALGDTTDQIFRFATIEIKAKAKALESVMSQDGYVNPNFKIN